MSMSMTYRTLLDCLNELSDDELDQPVTVFLENTMEYHEVDYFDMAVSTEGSYGSGENTFSLDQYVLECLNVTGL